MSKRVMCFGDSLTWGWCPVEGGAPALRYGRHQRWSRLLGDRLGVDIVEEGLSGRTTDLDDPSDERLNGARHLPTALASQLPLDVLVLMLGTNDAKAGFARSPLQIATGMSTLLGLVARSAGGVGTAYPVPKVLLVAPPPLSEIPHPWFRAVFEHGHDKVAALPALYHALADFAGVSFFDAGSVITTDGLDGIHLSVQNNVDLAQALEPLLAAVLR